MRRRGKSSWEVTIDLGRDAHGQRLRKFVTIRGRKADAERRLRELLSLTDKGIPINAQKVTLAQWLERWLTDYVAPHARPKTIERYESVIRKYLIPHLGQVELPKLAPADIQALEAKLTAQGMAPAGVDLIHNVLSGAFKYALRMEMVWRNPCQAVTPPKVVHKEVQPPEIAAVKHILDIARAEEHPFYSCLYLLAYTGVRRGEALGMRWRDTDLEAGTISIAQTLIRCLHQVLIFQPPKTNSGRRTIDLDASTVEVLRTHRGQQLLHKLQAEGAYQDSDLVFADPLGAPLNPMAVTRVFQGLAKRVGMGNIRLHDLRHFHASVMFKNGQSPALVSKRLGHASVSTTMDIYTHILPGWQREAANAFAKAMEEG
ncbi:MAG: site-specific integrase [Dehalococcoidia bacterium]